MDSTPLSTTAQIQAGQYGRPTAREETHHPATVLEDDLANLISRKSLLLAGDSFPDHQLHHEVLGQPKKLGHTSGEQLRIELESKLDVFLPISPVNVLPKPTKVDDFSTNPSPLRVEVAGLDRMVSQRQCMQDARLPRAVGAVDQRERSQWHSLGDCERLEVGDVERFQNHRVLSTIVRTAPGGSLRLPSLPDTGGR